MVNLTNKLVASVKPPRDKKYIRLWDDNISGFGLRVTDNGVKSFIFEGKQLLSKKTKQVKIGRVGQMSVSEAMQHLPRLTMNNNNKNAYNNVIVVVTDNQQSTSFSGVKALL